MLYLLHWPEDQLQISETLCFTGTNVLLAKSYCLPLRGHVTKLL